MRKTILKSFLIGLAVLFISGIALPNNKYLAMVNVTDSITDITLPVFEHYSVNSSNDYALVIESLESLKNSGLVFTLLDRIIDDGIEYYIATKDKNISKEASLITEILLDDGERVLIKVNPNDALKLVSYGYDIKLLNDQPIKTTPSKNKPMRYRISYDNSVNDMLNQVTTARAFELGEFLTGIKPAIINGSPFTIRTRNTSSGSMINNATQWAFDFFSNLGLDVSFAEWSTGTNFGDLSGRNVVAEISGTTKPDEIIIIIAHLDNMPSGNLAPGADDNASGSIGVMMAAEILKDYNFEKTIRFILVTGEEQGLHGSKAYANAVQNENIVAVFNLDMIAFDNNSDGRFTLHTRPPSDPDHQLDLALCDVLIDVMNSYQIPLNPLIMKNGESRSDHASFWAVDIPAVLHIEDWNEFTPFYHTIGDTMDTLNLDYWINCIKMNIGAVAQIASSNKALYFPVNSRRDITAVQAWIIRIYMNTIYWEDDPRNAGQFPNLDHYNIYRKRAFGGQWGEPIARMNYRTEGLKYFDDSLLCRSINEVTQYEYGIQIVSIIDNKEVPSPITTVPIGSIPTTSNLHSISKRIRKTSR